MVVEPEVSSLTLEEGSQIQVCVDATNDFERDIIVNVASAEDSAQGKAYCLDTASTYSPYPFPPSLLRLCGLRDNKPAVGVH